MCFFVVVVVVVAFFLSAAEIINQQIEIRVCFVDIFSPLEEGVKVARNFLIFWNGNLHC